MEDLLLRTLTLSAACSAVLLPLRGAWAAQDGASYRLQPLLLAAGLGLTALLSWPLFALLGFPMPERLALLFFLIGGADLFRKLSQERDELVRKLLRLKLPGGRKGVTEQ